jgi:hypothetical protein
MHSALSSLGVNAANGMEWNPIQTEARLRVKETFHFQVSRNADQHVNKPIHIP